MYVTSIIAVKVYLFPIKSTIMEYILGKDLSQLPISERKTILEKWDIY